MANFPPWEIRQLDGFSPRWREPSITILVMQVRPPPLGVGRLPAGEPTKIGTLPPAMQGVPKSPRAEPVPLVLTASRRNPRTSVNAAEPPTCTPIHSARVRTICVPFGEIDSQRTAARSLPVPPLCHNRRGRDGHRTFPELWRDCAARECRSRPASVRWERQSAEKWQDTATQTQPASGRELHRSCCPLGRANPFFS